jgi:hypothetical protein
VPFRPLAGDPGLVLGSEKGKKWNRSGDNSFAFILMFVRLTRSYMIELFRTIQEAVTDADLIIFSPFTGRALDIGEARGVDTMLAALPPFFTTREFPDLGTVGTFEIPIMNWMSQ